MNRRKLLLMVIVALGFADGRVSASVVVQEPVGGQSMAGQFPAATIYSGDSTSIDLFYIDPTGGVPQMKWTWYDGSGWPVVGFPHSNEILDYNPPGAASTDGWEHIFWARKGQHLFPNEMLYLVWDPYVGWWGPSVIETDVVPPIVAVSWPGCCTDVFYDAGGLNFVHSWMGLEQSPGLTAPEQIPVKWARISSAIYFEPWGTEIVFGVGDNDGLFYYFYYWGQSADQIQPQLLDLSGYPAGYDGPTAVSANGAVHLFWTTIDALLAHLNLTTGEFDYLPNAYPYGPPAVVSRGDQRIDVFYDGWNIPEQRYRLEHIVYIDD